MNAFNFGSWEQCANLIRSKITSDDQRGFLIAECPANMPGAIECARLISCAPELLEASQACVAVMLQNGVPTDPEHPARVALSAAEAAISKALGERTCV